MVLRISLVSRPLDTTMGSGEWSHSRLTQREASPAALPTQDDEVIDSLATTLPAARAMVAEATEEVAHRPESFPGSSSGTIWSRTRSGRAHHEIERRTNVVGVFGNDAALGRLVTAIVLGQHGKWGAFEQHDLSEESMVELETATRDDRRRAPRRRLGPSALLACWPRPPRRSQPS